MCTRCIEYLVHKILLFAFIRSLQSGLNLSTHNFHCLPNMQIHKQSLYCIWAKYQQSLVLCFLTFHSNLHGNQEGGWKLYFQTKIPKSWRGTFLLLP